MTYQKMPVVRRLSCERRHGLSRHENVTEKPEKSRARADRGRAWGYSQSVSSLGTLYVVATPIGNADDLSLRARQLLAEVDWIAAEDTRVLASRLRDWGIQGPRTLSLHDHNERTRASRVVRLLQQGNNVALVSDAGTPLISDPGFRVVQQALQAGTQPRPVPGACAVVAALSGSGLPTDRFAFHGFLPRKKGERLSAIRSADRTGMTNIFFEAPHRIRAALEDLAEVVGTERLVVVVRELTKPWETWLRGTAAAVRDALTDEQTRGEMTLLVAPPEDVAVDDRVDQLICALVDADVGVGVVRDVVARVYDRPRREIYQRALARRDALTDEEA